MQEHATSDTYYVPPPSIWPLVGSVALLALASGFALLLNKFSAGPYLMALGMGILLIMLSLVLFCLCRKKLSEIIQ